MNSASLQKCSQFLPRPVLVAVAIVFLIATTTYSFLWISNAQHLSNSVEIGFNAARETRFDPDSSSIPVYNVVPGSPAEQAGLRAGDRLTAINGKQLSSFVPFQDTWSKAKPGDMVQVTVRRPGEAQPVQLSARFRAVAQNSRAEGLAQESAQRIISLYPIFFLLVGFAVLLLRLDDPTAWLLATLFACFITVPGFHDPAQLSPSSQLFVNLFRVVFDAFIAPMFYIFFALFPERSWLDKKLPWLKWFALLFGASQSLAGWRTGDPRWPDFMFKLLGDPFANTVRLAILYSLLVLGIVSLLLNSFRRPMPTATRRKSRVILWGTLIGILPIVLQRLAADFTGYEPSFWPSAIIVILVLLYPLSFAYAVIRYRVLEIPALLRRSARYVLVQRGFAVLIVAGAFLAIYLFTHLFSNVFKGNAQVGMGLSAVFGVALVWASSPFVKRGTQRIDRAFFRSSYDARVILQDLVEKTRTVTDREELAALLEEQITRALHPKRVAFYCEAPDGAFVAKGRAVPSGVGTLPQDTEFLKELAAHGRAWDVPPVGSPEYPASFPLAALSPECLVPLLARDARLVGLFVLGQPRSEEPYSSADKRLLESVAGQAAAALENIRLAERIADRLEVERSAAREMQIALEVQKRLFPQSAPPLATLKYAGDCLQARQVGGDYYDYLNVGSSRMAFVLADISGKGIAAALLMSNLQANLRSRYATAYDDLPQLLSSVNQLAVENSPEDRYATMFLGVYDDASRTLTYANCGHNPPLLFRANGAVERLTATATVIGLFTPWPCETRTCQLAPGDILVIYTDGVTEAEDGNAVEFGEARLVKTVRSNSNASPLELLRSIQNAVKEFSVGEQFDDLTLVIGRVQ